MNDQKLDKLFANKLAKHKVKPSADAWKRIDNQLGGKNDKPFVWWQLMLAGFLFISLSVGAYSIYNTYNSDNSGLLDSSNLARIELQDFEIQTIEALNLNNVSSKKSTGNKKIENQGNKLENKLMEDDSDGKNITKNGNSIKSNQRRKQNITQSNRKKEKNIAKINDREDAEKSKIDVKAVPFPEENTSLFDAEKELLILESKKVNLEIKPIKNNEIQKDSVKRKRIKVEITIPHSKQDNNKRKGGEQETQSFAIHFKSVLKNVLSN